MCVEMVIIGKKSLDKKNDDVTSKSTSVGAIPVRTMSHGTALFSCGIMEASRWRDAALSSPSLQPKADFGSGLESLWSRPLEASPGHCSSLSSLLQDLNLSARTELCSAAPSSLRSNTEACSTAPPSKRQCRSLSCSDDLSRSIWRPQGSRLWTSVEKRRCHSGGSVQRTSAASTFTFPSMQRSSSVNLAFPGTPCAPPPRPERSVSPRGQTPSPRSSPDSTPETERRRGQSSGLPRSRSQPCVLNEKKAGVKRRRQDEADKRPSLDLAKMTQKLRSFHSLSCPGISSDDRCDPNHGFFDLALNPSPFDNRDLNKLYADRPGHGTKESTGNRPFCPTIEDCGDATPPSHNRKDGEALWAGRCSLYQLGGELDIEQIERN